MAEKIAMLGGSFNPIHKGHIKLALAAAETVGLNKVLIIPTAVPPHKSNRKMESEIHRLNMCRLACENKPGLEVSDLEIQRQGKSYTADTLQTLHKRYRRAQLYLIVGADMYVTLLNWKFPETIFSLATVITAPRDETDYDALIAYEKQLEQAGAKSVILKNHIMDISSTEIRNMIHNRKDMSLFLEKDVITYIKDNHLYRM